MGITISILFALAASLAAVEVKNREVTLIAFAAAGIGLSISFLLAGAPLVSLLLFIAELTVISILARICCKEVSSDRPDRREIVGSVISLIFIAAAVYSIYLAFKDIPAPGFYPAIGIGERVLDDVVAVAALLAASVGALAVLRKEK